MGLWTFVPIPYCCGKNHVEFFHTRMLCSAWWGRTRKSQELAHRKCDHIKNQGPVSTMQKTGITNYSSLMILSGLEKGYHPWIWSLLGSRQPFFCVFGHFWHGDTRTIEQTNNLVILEQACSWSVRRQSVAISMHLSIDFFYIKQHDGMEYEDPESQNPAWQPCQRGRGTGRREVKKQFLNF